MRGVVESRTRSEDLRGAALSWPLIFVAVGLVIVVVAIASHLAAPMPLVSAGIAVNGRITDLRSEADGDETIHTVAYRFLDGSGRTFDDDAVVDAAFVADRAIGEQVTVRYLAGDPSQSEIVGFRDSTPFFAPAALWVTLGSVAIIFGLVAVGNRFASRRSPTWQQQWESPDERDARIEIERNEAWTAATERQREIQRRWGGLAADGLDEDLAASEPTTSPPK